MLSALASLSFHYDWSEFEKLRQDMDLAHIDSKMSHSDTQDRYDWWGWHLVTNRDHLKRAMGLEDAVYPRGLDQLLKKGSYGVWTPGAKNEDIGLPHADDPLGPACQ